MNGKALESVHLPVLPRPSNAHQWVGGGCTGCIELASKYARESGAPALEGNRLHDVARTVLAGEVSIDDVDPDDRKIIEPYIDEVRAILAAASDVVLHYVERGFEWKRDDRLKGTPDDVVVDTTRKHLTITDLKTGRGVVEAFENWQLLCYALFLLPEGWTCTLVIVQPRAFHVSGPVRRWSFDWATFVSYRERIVEAWALATSEISTLTTGDHCRYCDGLHACPAHRRASLHVVDWADRVPVEMPLELVAQELALVNEAKTLLTHRAAALEEMIWSKLRAGVRVPFIATEPSSAGKREWSDDNAAATLAVFAGRVVTKPKLPTPKQLIDAGVSKELVHALSFHKPGKSKIRLDLDGKIAKAMLGGKPDTSHIPGIKKSK